MASSPQATNAITLENERHRFKKLHGGREDAAELFSKLLETAGLEKLHQHNNNLGSVFNLSKLQGLKLNKVMVYWDDFILKGNLTYLDDLKSTLAITNKDDAEKTTTLIQCAHFVRFPERDASKLTEADMLNALGGSGFSAQEKVDRPEEIELNANVVQQGFLEEYQRRDLIVAPTLKTLNDFAAGWRVIEYVAPYTSLIGPTMSGKTRLIKELAKHVCVVYVCLRPEKSSGQPPRSTIADHFFPLREKDMTTHYALLVATILNVVSQFFSRPDVCAKSAEEQLSEWFDYSFQMDRTSKVDFNHQIDEAMTKMKEEGQCRLESFETMRAAAEKMNRTIKFIPGKQLKVLLAIDEASHLIGPTDKSSDIPYFRALRRALSRIPEANGFFSIFTDTTSRVANFNPALDQDPSARNHGSGVDLYAPIFKISTFDVFVSQAPSSWDDLLSPERLFCYGCPFYELYFKGLKKTQPKDATRATTDIALSKLLFTTQSALSQPLTEQQCFAILGSLIQTRVTLHSPINSQLVSNHAAHCIFIDSSRKVVVSDYPPQFSYASAANRALESGSDDTRWIKCIDTLAFAMKKGHVALGDAGEMATRLILIRAMQKTKSIPFTGEETQSIPNGYSVRLIDFLQTLSGEDPRTMKFDCIEQSDKERLLNEGRIFFNHFTRISYTPSATDFLELLYRGVAAQCKNQQPGFDDLFTIYLAPTSECPELNLKNITFCGVQTKNQERSVRWTDSADWCKSYASIKGINNPYLVLLFSLKTTSRDPKWNRPKIHNDTHRVSYQFLGLNKIHCITDEIRSALNRLITAVPDDLMNLYTGPDQVKDELTVPWIKQLYPVFYPRDLQQPIPQSSAPSRKPSKRPKECEGANHLALAAPKRRPKKKNP